MQIHPNVQVKKLMSGVTTNTASDAIRVPSSGNKTFWAEVAGTGAVTATVAIYGCRTPVAENGVLLATITLTDTTRDQDAAATATAPYPYLYAITTNVTGTGATVNVEVFY